MINAYRNSVGAKNQQIKFQNLSKFVRLGKSLEKSAGEDLTSAFQNVSQIRRLLSNHLLNNLPDEDFVRLLPSFEPISLRAGQQLDDFSGSVSVVFFPEDAVISTLCILPHGATIETSMTGREGLVGLEAIFNLEWSNLIPQVVIAGRALKVKTDILKKELRENANFQSLLLSYSQMQNAQTARRTGCIAFHRAVSRFSTWLLMLNERGGSSRLNLTQDQISQALGVHRPSITHAAQSLRDEGLIDYSRGQIVLKNIAGLKKNACDCYTEVSQVTNFQSNELKI